MAEAKKRTFESDARLPAGMRLTTQPGGKQLPRGAGARSKSPDPNQQERQELIYRLIEFLKDL